MQARIKFSGDIVQDVLAINGMDDMDYAIIDSCNIYYNPENLHLLKQFIDEHDALVFVTDCDADGLSAAGVVMSYFDDEHQIILGKRTGERGLSLEIVEEIYNNHGRMRLGIITLDCGMTNYLGVHAALTYGYDVFITDHHRPQAEIPNVPIINPQLEHIVPLFKELCGAGVIYTCLSRLYGENTEALQYAAIGTICDVVPILYDNRYIVRQGLYQLTHSPSVTIASVFKALKISSINEKSISWYFGPAINAASRFGKEQIAFDAYVCGDVGAANQLKQLNQNRKGIVQSAYLDAKVYYKNNVIIATIESDAAIAGLVAMKFVNEESIPACVCVYSDGIYNCSIRSVGAFSASDYIQQSKYVIGGGHEAAAGFSVKALEFNNFLNELAEYVKNNPGVVTDTQLADIEISFSAAKKAFNIMQQELSPFGVGFRAPVFVTKKVKLTPDHFSFTVSGHLRIKSTIELYYYNPPPIAFDGTFDISYEMEYAVWQKGPTGIIQQMERIN